MILLQEKKKVIPLKNTYEQIIKISKYKMIIMYIADRALAMGLGISYNSITIKDTDND